MRTWRQGVVGIITLSDSEFIYVHYHKYPCALFYKEYDSDNNVLESYLFTVMVEKGVLKSINRIGAIKLTKEDQKKSESIIYHSRENVVEILRNMNSKASYTEKLYTIEEIEEKYFREKNQEKSKGSC